MDSRSDSVILPLSELDAPESPLSSWNYSSDSTSSSSEESTGMAFGNSLSSALERSLKIWQVQLSIFFCRRVLNFCLFVMNLQFELQFVVSYSLQPVNYKKGPYGEALIYTRTRSDSRLGAALDFSWPHEFSLENTRGTQKELSYQSLLANELCFLSSGFLIPPESPSLPSSVSTSRTPSPFATTGPSLNGTGLNGTSLNGTGLNGACFQGLANEGYSRKVFTRGFPPDIDEDEIKETLFSVASVTVCFSRLTTALTVS